MMDDPIPRFEVGNIKLDRDDPIGIAKEPSPLFNHGRSDGNVVGPRLRDFEKDDAGTIDRELLAPFSSALQMVVGSMSVDSSLHLASAGTERPSGYISSKS